MIVVIMEQSADHFLDESFGVWSTKRQLVVKNQCFLKPKMTPSNVSVCSQPQDISLLS